MKKVFVSILIVLSLCMEYSFAVETTFTTSIYGDSYGSSTSQQPIINHGISAPRRIIIHNQIHSMPAVENAIYQAEAIFSKAMQQQLVDMVNMKVDLEWGDSTLYVSDELCKVDIVYTNSMGFNPSYPHIGETPLTSYPVLFPKALSNQSFNNGNGKIMTIRLNPNIQNQYHCDTTICPNDKYDMITVLLRALAMGCGMQSTLHKDNGIVGGISIGNQTYINAYDALIYNDGNSAYEDALTNSTMTNFLNGHNVYIHTNDGEIKLYNDLEYFSNFPNLILTDQTLNTISYDTYNSIEQDTSFIDLMEGPFTTGMSMRRVTHYTMSIFKQLGWLRDVATNSNATNCETVLEQCALICQSSSILSPNTTYYVSASANSVYISNTILEIDAIDSTFQIGNSNNSSISYNSIPNNIQWRRNPISTNIVGHIKATVNKFCDDDEMHMMVKLCDIEIPYRPNRPIVQFIENAQNGNIILHLNIFSNGSNQITVTYTGLTGGDTHSFTKMVNNLDTTLTIAGGQLYNMTIYGTNSIGNSDSYCFGFGASVQPPFTLSTTISGNTTLYYYLLGEGGANAVIGSVQVLDPSGLILLIPNAGQGDPIDISSLSRGYKILTVVADGITYSKVFLKR